MSTPPSGETPTPRRSADVVTASPADADTLSHLIADAFFNLPPSRWLIPDKPARRHIFPRYFRIIVEHALASGTIYTTPGRSAAALWLQISPGGPVPPDGYSNQLAAVTGEWIDRFAAFDAVLGHRHPVGIAHHHLAILAVRPSQQGQGAGSTLLRAFHQQLDDASGMPAYLEAASPRTRDLYLRHGYTDLGSPIQLPGGPAMYPMLREPGSRQQPHRPTPIRPHHPAASRPGTRPVRQ